MKIENLNRKPDNIYRKNIVGNFEKGTNINIPIGQVSTNTNTLNDNSLSKIFGANFTSSANGINGDTDNELNGVIGNFKQQQTTGDCMILADLKALSLTFWGKKLIKDTIIPDGKGGALVVLKGAPGGEKRIPVPKEIIDIVTNQNLTASGDKDVAVLEIALIQYLMDMGVNITNLTGEMLAKSKFKTGKELWTRLSGSGLLDLISNDPNISKVAAYNIPGLENFRKIFADKISLINTKDKNGNNIFSVTVGFRADTKLENINAGHEYIYKDIKVKNGKKYVILINPWNTENEITISYNDFLKYAHTIWMSYNEKSIAPNTRDKIKKVHEATIRDYTDKYNSFFINNYLMQVPTVYKANAINNMGGICEFEKRYLNKLKTDVNMIQKTYLKDGIKGVNNYIGVEDYMSYSNQLDKYLKETPLEKQFEDNKKNLYKALGFNQTEINNIMKNHNMLKVYCKKYGYKY